MNAINWTTRIAVVTAALVILSAGVLGYTALYDLFVSIGLFAAWLGIFFPLLFDLAEITAAVSVFNAKLQGEDDKFAWGMVILFTVLGIVANVGHAIAAWWTGRIDTVQVILAVFATSLFPLSVALVTHLVKRVIARDITRRGLLDTLAKLAAQIDTRQRELDTLTRQVETLQCQVGMSNIEKSDTKIDTLNDARSAKRQERLDTLRAYLLDNPHANLTEAAAHVGVSRQTVGEYVKELGLHKNGNGWEVISQ